MCSYKAIKPPVRLVVNLNKTMYKCIFYTYKNHSVAFIEGNLRSTWHDKDWSWKFGFLKKCFCYFANNSGLKQIITFNGDKKPIKGHGANQKKYLHKN